MSQKTLLALALFFIFTVFVAAPAEAQQRTATVEISFAPEVRIGQKMDVEAYVLNAEREPVVGEKVFFEFDTMFMNVPDAVYIGRAITNADGLARLVYVPKTEGEITVTARLIDVEGREAANDSKAMFVAPGPETYAEDAPFRMPGANITVVVLVLIAVWGLFLVIIMLFWLISRDGANEPAKAEIGR